MTGPHTQAPIARPLVLILNAYGAFLRRPVTDALDRAGFDVVAASDLAEAVQIAKTQRLGGMVVGLNLKPGDAGALTESGLSLMARFLKEIADPRYASRPILVTVTHRASGLVVEEEAARHGIENPRLIASKDDVLDPDFCRAIRQHFEQDW